MKKPKLELTLSDLDVARLNAGILDGLKLAALSRPRCKIYTPVGRKVAALGIKPNLDTWRDVARRVLRRKLGKGFIIYVGGHHLAVHKPKANASGKGFGPCIGRIVEVTPI